MATKLARINYRDRSDSNGCQSVEQVTAVLGWNDQGLVRRVDGFDARGQRIIYVMLADGWWGGSVR
jgi:hypothetical protein